MTHPNILFIIADQHNAKVLGHAGHPQVRTLHLDRMAAEGVRFTNAISQNPICTPSRMCCLSGQYPHNHGHYGLSGPNPGGLPTILGHFRRVGVTEFAWSKSVRKGNYRLVYYPPQIFPEDYPDGFGKLYDLDADPWEMRNRYFEPEYADVARDLRGELLDWLVTTARPCSVLGVNSHRAFPGTQSRIRYGCQVNADNKIDPSLIGGAWKHYV